MVHRSHGRRAICRVADQPGGAGAGFGAGELKDAAAEQMGTEAVRLPAECHASGQVDQGHAYGTGIGTGTGTRG